MIRLLTAGGVARRNSGSRPGQASDNRVSARLPHRIASATTLSSGRSEALRRTPVGTVTDAPDQRIPRTFGRDRGSPSTPPTTARRLDARVGDEIYRMRASGGIREQQGQLDEEDSRSSARWRSWTRPQNSCTRWSPPEQYPAKSVASSPDSARSIVRRRCRSTAPSKLGGPRSLALPIFLADQGDPTWWATCRNPAQRRPATNAPEPVTSPWGFKSGG